MICQKIQTLGHIGGGFRLLNSEIGNDPKLFNGVFLKRDVFVSLTRR